jgi:O-antigen/teichoic acid export membrane protein
MAAKTFSGEESPASDFTATARAGGALLVASFFGNGVNYLFGIFLARMLGAEDFGLYTLGIGFFNAVVLLVLFGFNMGIVKVVSESLSLKKITYAKRTIAFALLVCFAGGIVAAAGLAWGAAPFAGSFYHKPALEPVLWILAVAIPFAAASTVVISALQTFETVRYTIAVKYLWEPFGKFMFAGIVLGMGYGLNGVVFSIGLVCLGSLLMALYGLRHIAKFRLQDYSSWNLAVGKPLLVFCAPLMIANFFSAVAPRFDIFFLGYWGQTAQVGMYAAAFQTAAILPLILGAFDRTFAPVIGRKVAQQDTEGLSSMYRSQARLVLLLTMFPLVVLTVFANEILLLFGPAFPQAGHCLVILAVAQAFYCATGSASILLLMGGYSRMVMMNTIGLGVLLICLGWFLIPGFGMAGAAGSAGLSLVLMNVVQVAQVWHLHKVHPYSRGLWKPVIAGGMAALVCIAGKWLFEDIPFWTMIPLGGLVYVSLLVSLKLETAEQRLVKELIKEIGCRFPGLRIKEAAGF